MKFRHLATTAGFFFFFISSSVSPLSSDDSMQRPTNTPAADAKEQGLSPYVPGQIIIEYNLQDSSRFTGAQIDQEHGSVIQSVEEILGGQGLKLKRQANGQFYRPIHDVIINKMKKGKSEKQVIEEMIDRRHKIKKEPASKRVHITKNYGFSRKLLIELADLKQDINRAIHLLEDPQSLKNASIKEIKAQPNHIFQASFIPNDPRFTEQWGLHNTGQYGGAPDADVDAPEAWNITQGSPDAVIAVIDSGVDYNHPDLAQNVWINQSEIPDNGIDDDNNGYIDDVRGWDFLEEGGSACDPIDDCNTRDNDPMDVLGHGTHVAGIIAAVTNNSIGVAGVCPQCKIMATRLIYQDINDAGLLIETDFEVAILYAVDNGADVINMSIGHEAALIDLVDGIIEELHFADAAGVVLVAAAGNFGTNEEVYPAAFEEVIAVAATNRNNQRAWFSSYGDWVDISAPGESILSLLPNNGYAYKSGTSMSAPHVAGVAALLKSVNPALGSQEIKQLLYDGSIPFNPPSNVPIGSGIVNAYLPLFAISTQTMALILSFEADRDGAYFDPQEELQLSFQIFVLNLSVPLRATLMSEDPRVQVIVSDAEFITEQTPGFVNNHGSKFVLLNVGEEPIVGDLTIQIHIDGLAEAIPFAVPLDVIENHPGWPKLTFGQVYSSAAVADLDGDGMLEVVVGSSDSYVYAWHSDGRSLDGWPKRASLGGSSPAISDLDGDGMLEIVVGSSSFVYAWHSNGIPVDGWPVGTVTGRAVRSSPAIADLDPNYSGLEVVVGSDDGNVYAWHNDGSAVTGWPQTGGSEIYASPTIADLNGDGALEVIVGSYNGDLYAWEHDGTLLAGWPVVLIYRGYESSPAVADIDSLYPGLEVIVGSRSSGRVYVWHADGSLALGWPQSTGGSILSSPAIADLDLDYPGLEIVVGTIANAVFAWHSDGSPVQGWPKLMNEDASTSPAIADLDGNGTLEVIVGCWDDTIYAWHHDGNLVEGWPLIVPRTAGLLFPPSPAIADLDGDRRLEVIIGSGDHNVYAWTMPHFTDDRTPWPTFRHDPQHTGLYTPPNHPPVLNPIGDKTVGEGDLLEFTVTATDPNRGDILTLTTEGLPPRASFVDHGDGTGTFTWRVPWLSTLDRDSFHVTFRASDGTESISETITIRVSHRIIKFPGPPRPVTPG